MRYKNQFIRLTDCYGNECEVMQVSKRKAEKVYNSNKNIWVHPCNMTINNVWQTPYFFNKALLDTKYSDAPTFDNLINQYQYYNCNNQVGNYPIFFIEKSFNK